VSVKSNQVVVDITIAAPIETVWSALRDPAQVEQWFGWDAPTLAEEVRDIFVDNATVDTAAHQLRFQEWEGVVDMVELTAVAGGTRLRVVRAGGGPIDWDGVYEDITQGWINFFQQLRLALELHPGQTRRTIYLSGAAQAGVGEPSEALGLTDVAAYEPGQPYAAVMATGDTAKGVVWYGTHFQTALLVEQWNNGLIVVTDKGVAPRRPHGGGSVLITTYDLPEAEFAALEQRWQGWWAERYGSPAF
jgi:hypothetical protein